MANRIPLVLNNGFTQQLRSSDTLSVSALTSSGQIVSTLATGTAPFAVSSTSTVANLNIGGSANTVTWPAQTSITSVGTLTSLSVTGTITGNISGSANVATNIAAGAVGSIPYQTAANTTAMLGIGSTNNVLTVIGGLPSWQPASGGGATITDDTSTAATRYPLFSANTSGSATTVYTSSTKFNFNPNTGVLSSTIFTSLSDATVKENIMPIMDAIETVTQLEGVSFNWKENGAKSYGVIAQELEKILPDLVATADGLKTINYSGLIGFLINAVKEMDARIKVLENK